MSADHKPVKGILKPSASFDKEGHQSRPDKEKEMKWDEMNILATYHPADKDYGYKKIDEPPTPYNRLSESEGECQSGDEDNVLDPQNLALGLSGNVKPKLVTKGNSSEEDEDEDEGLTEEERAKKREFVKRRKLHYNEFQAVQLARQLLESEELEDEEGPDASGCVVGESESAFEDVQGPCEMDTIEQLTTGCPVESGSENL